MSANMKRFEVGKVYGLLCIGEMEDTRIPYAVTARTDSTVTLRGKFIDSDGEVVERKFRIAKRETEWEGAEVVWPRGRYSMAPSLSAREVA